MRVLRNARLADRRRVDIHISEGLISAVEDAGSPVPAGTEIDYLTDRLVILELGRVTWSGSSTEFLADADELRERYLSV